jgi:hypothetical protein
MPPSTQDISQKIQELQSTQSQVRFWRTLTVIAVILIVVTCVGLMSGSVTRLTSPGETQEEFIRELMAGVNQDVVPEVQRIARVAAADVAPLVQAELNQLNLRAPDFAEALRKELYSLSINVTSRGEKVLDETVGNIVKKRQNWIEQEFEGVTPEKAQTMAENLVTIAHDRIEHLSDTFFADHIVALNQITENLHQIQQAELANVRHEVPNWEMALLFFDIVRDELRGIETLNVPTHALDAKVGGDTGEVQAAEEIDQ